MAQLLVNWDIPMDTITIPDFDWYAKKSKALGTTPRCPHASASRCPRYFESLSMMEFGGTTKMDRAEEDRLRERWSKTDLTPKLDEQRTYIMQSNSRPIIFANFCPEVSFDIYSYFTSSFGDYTDEIDRDAAHRQLNRSGAHRNERWRWSYLNPTHYSACSLYSLLNSTKATWMIDTKRAYLERRLANIAEGIVEDCMLAVNYVMSDAAKKNALSNSRVWLRYNAAIFDTIKNAIPTMVRFTYEVAEDNSQEASSILNAAIRKLSDDAIAALVKRTSLAATAFGETPMYEKLEPMLAKLRETVVDDFDHGFEGGVPLKKGSHSGISVIVSDSPGAQIATGDHISQSMINQSKVLIEAIDEVISSDSFNKLNADQAEVVRGLADLVKAESLKGNGDKSKIKAWTERIKFVLETAKLAVEASKIGSALITFASAMG